MFELSQNEKDILKSQSVILKQRGPYAKYVSFAFTEQGVIVLYRLLNGIRVAKVTQISENCINKKVILNR